MILLVYTGGMLHYFEPIRGIVRLVLNKMQLLLGKFGAFKITSGYDPDTNILKCVVTCTFAHLQNC